jgi:hypothetical protein
MLYGLIADLVVILHLAFVVIVLSGGLRVLWRRRAAWLHLPAAAWGTTVEFVGWSCPQEKTSEREIHQRPSCVRTSEQQTGWLLSTTFN